MSSLVYQNESAFKAIFTSGQSRHAAKRRGETDEHLCSFATIEKYLGLVNDFAQWARARYGIRRIGDVTPEMVTAFIAECQRELLPNGRHRSPSTINSYLDALSKLDTALRAKG